ncbi:Transposase IS200-like protein [sediment metagenome]|uniref:Transposase IS200-like protein n=1 Tax=sediment metagenome TaxID=749907 RepID=D9PJD1_9ZZZZ
MEMKKMHYSHAVGEFNYHIQITPAYRADVFRNERTKNLTKAYLVAKVEELKLSLVAIEFGPNHVHIFLANCKNYAPCKIVQFLKGFSSRMMRKNHWELFRCDLWGDKFWSEGYFARSIGETTSEAVEHYILESQSKHWS